MFDLSWIELTFCLTLALVVLGPKDLPRLVNLVSSGVRRMRRMSTDLKGSITKLEREIALSQEDRDDPNAWQELIPPEIRELRRSIRAHGPDKAETARRYRLYKEAAAKARADYEAGRLPAAADHPRVP